GIGDAIVSPGDVNGVGQHAPGFSQIFGTADAEGAGDAPVLEVPDGELAPGAVAAPDLLVPVLGRADVLEASPVGEVAEEVGDDLVVAVGAEHVAGGVDALLHRHVPVLDMDAAAMDDALIGAAVAGGVDASGRGLQLRVADDRPIDLES